MATYFTQVTVVTKKQLTGDGHTLHSGNCGNKETAGDGRTLHSGNCGNKETINR